MILEDHEYDSLIWMSAAETDEQAMRLIRWAEKIRVNESILRMVLNGALTAMVDGDEVSVRPTQGKVEVLHE